VRLKGKKTIVTGGGQGIGEAVARAFDREGASVAILDIDVRAAKRIAAALRHGIAVECDISRSADVDAAFEHVQVAFGGLDVLAHVAAIKAIDDLGRLLHVSRKQAEELEGSGQISTFLDSIVNMTDTAWQRQIDVDLTGTFYCNRAALRIMAAQRSGSIINTASNTAITGMAGVANYAAAKAGVLGFSRSVAQEVIRQGIRVNVVAPGGTDTPMPSEEVAVLKRQGARHQPIGRLGMPTELAAAYVFLASDESSFIVGETLNVNGGLHTL